MTTIDHRILIPAPPDAVWDFVSDITRNPDWQVDCTEVIFLTSRREGPGLRWRYATPGGHEMVIAVTAWYNGLGYEYYFVDGTPFRENKGRIRLQEIPEGTIVQWTFTYELGGVLGGMRNSLGMKRQVDQTIAESLKTLWQKIKQTGGAARTLEPKSLMRDAPDVEARSAYQPRHPSVVDMDEAEKSLRGTTPPAPMKVEPPIWDDDAQPIRVFEEPPVVEDDTRPRSPFAPPAASKPAPAPEIDADFEPDFLDDLVDEEAEAYPFDLSFDEALDKLDAVDDDVWQSEPSIDPSDTQPRTIEDVIAAAFRSEVTESVVEIRPAEATEPFPVDYAGAESADNEHTTAEIVDLETEAALDTSAAPIQPETPVTPAATTESASIWEIFGVPRPSETQELSQLEIDAAASEPEAVTEAAEVAEADTTLSSEPTEAAVLAAVVAEAVEAEIEAEAEAVTEAAVIAEDAPAITEAEAEPEAKASVVGVLSPVAATLELPAMPTRVGLRITQRRKLIHLRRP